MCKLANCLAMKLNSEMNTDGRLHSFLSALVFPSDHMLIQAVELDSVAKSATFHTAVWCDTQHCKQTESSPSISWCYLCFSGAIFIT